MVLFVTKMAADLHIYVTNVTRWKPSIANSIYNPLTDSLRGSTSSFSSFHCTRFLPHSRSFTRDTGNVPSEPKYNTHDLGAGL